MLVGIGRQRQHGSKEQRQMLAVERPVDMQIVAGPGDNVRVEGAPEDSGGVAFYRQMNDRRAPLDGQVDNLGRAPAAAGRQPVPNRDQDVAMGDGPPAGHDIGLQRIVGFARQLERAARICHEVVKSVPALVIVEVGNIGRAVEGQDHLQPPPARQCRLRRHLVGPLRERRNQSENRRHRCKQLPLALVQSLGLDLDRFQRFGDPRLDAGTHLRRYRFQPVPGDTDGQGERKRRRAGCQQRLPPA
jgi:hypothetical protein